MHIQHRELSASTSLGDAIERAAHLLPAQGPIGVFIHHNTLHAFEHMPFEDAVVKASEIFGAEPFMQEREYRTALSCGRIRERDVDLALDADFARRDIADMRLASGRTSRRALRRALLLHHVELESDASASWAIREGGALAGNSLEPAAGSVARFEACRRAAMHTEWPISPASPPVRLRDLLVAHDASCDPDELVHPLLIRICAAFLDQGVAAWPMPLRERGMLHATVQMWSALEGARIGWTGQLRHALAQVQGMDARQVIDGELAALALPSGLVQDTLDRTVLALRGWAGMVRQFEERPDRAPLIRVPASLDDFIALRLIMDRVAAMWMARRHGLARVDSRRPLASLRESLSASLPQVRPPGADARALQLHRITSLLGLTPSEVRSLSSSDVHQLEDEIRSFHACERRRLLHLAYERRHLVTVLDGLALHCAPPAAALRVRPSVQAIFCIDERFESVRRHFEEIGPDRETLGAAGFFAVAMYYRGLDDWHARPLCPIVVRPNHTVVEVPWSGTHSHVADWQRLRKTMGSMSGALISGGRTLVGGSIFAAVMGAAAAIPLVARVALPRLTASLSRSAARMARRRVRTGLALDREELAPLPDGTLPGFDVGEMAGIVRRLLEDIGLTSGLSRLVAVIGHGSSSRNNPHESAYDCGACGGGRGGANARAFATMANDPRVRHLLGESGLRIPNDTWFVGGLSNTCSDEIVLYDLERVPPSHAHDVLQLRVDLAHAACMGAHERSRRFASAPHSSRGPNAALRHVEARSEDLAQARPEYCHATNAVCVIGRRSRTRGLFLDRRAFLVSYDPACDTTGGILTRTLAAVGPVCAGISLEYYFSTVDRTAYGCGTKLPHNITGLIGVMDGHASDLRTGLPIQTTEIHEPVRLLVVIDAATSMIDAALAAVPNVKMLVDNRWIRAVSWDPLTGQLRHFDHGRWCDYAPEIDALPSVERSSDWYAGRSDDLPPATIRCATQSMQAGSAA